MSAGNEPCKNERDDMKTIDNDIKTGQLKRAYLLYGQERYLVRQYRDKLIKAMIPEGDTMNLSRYEGEDIDQEEIIDQAETLPFFAEHRLILIEDSGLFKKSGEQLAEYMPQAPETTSFLFVEEGIDKRSKMYKTLVKFGSAVEFGEQKDDVLSRWVVGRLRKEGKEITQAAYRLFIEKTGTDMENIDHEMEKLICYCMDKETVTPEDVEAVTTEQIQNKVFDMVDAIASHQQKKALDLYYDLLALKEPAMRIMYLVTRQFHLLLTVKAMTNQGFGNKDIAGKAGCPDWAVRKYQAQCRDYSLEQLKQAVRDGTEFEEAVKTGRLDERMAVELFIVQYAKKPPA